MEKNIADQLNKAFEAYRTASIERDNAKRELKQKTDYYERYTLKLQQQIEDQNQQISRLQAQLISATNHASGEIKCYETGHRKQEAEPLSPRPNKSSSRSYRTNHFLGDDIRDCSGMHLHAVAGVSGSETENILEAFQEIQGKFQLIRTLTKKQKDHLKRIHRGNDSANEPQFSMPIQCTDVTAERAEASFSSSSSSSSSSAVVRASVDEPVSASSLAAGGLAVGPLAVSSLASRGANPEDGDSVDSLTKLSVKFPPQTDSEYDFLNSTPEKPVELPTGTGHRTGLLTSVLPTIEEPSKEPFAYPSSLPPSSSIPSVTSEMLESVRGPQQALWSPELCDAAAVAAPPACAEPHQQENCAFCHASVPQDRMYSHLNSHFKNSACN
ncbi:TRAF family member-associated NF-kappa-B activator isoform X1 [Alosa alosa]|nr:TRAF family member-associated NF-kappa-B activator [Alosa sapidissima]XP_048095973.1 TRAF family member-associated NF-kappa-B activator isoform X1 [Alosa alosa]